MSRKGTWTFIRDLWTDLLLLLCFAARESPFSYTGATDSMVRAQIGGCCPLLGVDGDAPSDRCWWCRGINRIYAPSAQIRHIKIWISNLARVRWKSESARWGQSEPAQRLFETVWLRRTPPARLLREMHHTLLGDIHRRTCMCVWISMFN